MKRRIWPMTRRKAAVSQQESPLAPTATLMTTASEAQSGSGAGAGLPGRVRRLSSAIVDQALFAGSNFLLGVLTARWMAPEAYGAFATALAVYVLLTMLYEALLTEPMMVFGARRFSERFRHYIGVLLVGHLPLAVLGSALLLLTSVQLRLSGQSELSAAMLALAIMAPLILLRPLFRQACYANRRSRLATGGGLLYTVTLGSGLLAVKAYLDLTYLRVFGVIAVATLAFSLFIGWNLRPQAPDRVFASEVARRHWEFGKWTLGSQVIRWLPGHVWYFVLPLWVSLEHNAAFRALLNLNLIVNHTMSATAMVLLPALVRAHAGGEARFQSVSRDAMVLLVGLGLGYWIVVSLLAQPLIAWLYDGKYVEQSYLLILLGLAPLAGGIKIVSGTRARAVERPDIVFRTSLANLPVLVPGLAIGYWYGLTGVAVAYLLVALVEAGVLVYRTSGAVSRWAGPTANSAAEADEQLSVNS